ncbi:D-alanyl-D-alanine carboxypeptidase family protein [Paraburkholderia sp. DHOC27]|nr:D-alanyl-D-alanine carboxypeptidase family protein [Paraburkholderia sp. DHOC27]
MLNNHELTGRVRTHVKQYEEPTFAAQPEVAKAFLAMREKARRAGIDLIPYSSFRDFRTQLRIWNGKFSGKKPLYDMDGRVRDFASLSELDIIDCILNWSALPGGSRHQWGTEIDVIDGASVSPGYVPKLLPEEVSAGGVFEALHHWLDENIAEFGFFRPYASYNGGMYPEPWHLSFEAASTPALRQVTPELLTAVIRRADMLGKDVVLPLIPQIYERHILNINGPGTGQR